MNYWNKKIKVLSLLAIVGGISSGCATLTGHTSAMQMRQDSMVSKESKVVNRSLAQVAGTFKRMAPRCLQVAINYNGGDPRYTRTGIDIYTPRVKRSGNKMTFTLQMKRKETLHTYEPVKDGAYVMVVDAVSLGNNKTKVITYKNPYVIPDNFIAAIDGWATGKNVGCPSR